MNENVMQQENKQPEGFMSKALQAREQVANFGREATRMKNAVSNAISDTLEDGKREVRRAVKRSYHAAEDFVDETAQRVKHNPISSVALAFGVGTVCGVVCTGIVRKMVAPNK
jgi:ElaB/YqjD/DUF883 family membrane-anchored ribosome-binding protein